MGIRNRITEIRAIRLGDVQPNERNPRTHPDEQRIAYRGVLGAIGWAGVPLVYESDRQGGLTFLDGHMRQDETPELEVDVAVTDLSDDEADLFMLTYDPVGAMAGMSDGMVEELVESAQGYEGHDFDVDELLGAYSYVEKELPAAPEPQVDRAEELREKWGVETGQLWQLGEHRLICGDCTDGDVVDRLFDIGFASHFNLMLTDPPYNTNFDGKYNEVYTSTKDVNTIDETQEWDENFIVTEKALPLHVSYMSVDANYYIFCGWYPFWRYVFPFFHDRGEEWAAKPFIWCKPFALSNVRQTSTANATEPIVMAYKKGHLYNANRGVENYDYIVMSSNKGGRSAEHPTAKPLALIEHLMKMGSSEENAVFDPFLGSGTTLIACERLNRKCRAVEISPAYCAVAIERWHEMTGNTPVLLD